jgi:hypothetical protein
MHVAKHFAADTTRSGISVPELHVISASKAKEGDARNLLMWCVVDIASAGELGIVSMRLKQYHASQTYLRMVIAAHINPVLITVISLTVELSLRSCLTRMI